MKFFTVAKICIVILLLYLGYSNGTVSRFLLHMDNNLLLAIIYIQPLVLASLLTQSARHAILVSSPPVRFAIAFKAIALSTGMNLVLPGRLSELLKGTYLRNKAGIPLSAGVSAVLMERTVDLLIVGMLGLASVWFMLADVSPIKLMVLAVVCAGIFAVVFVFPNLVVGLADYLPWPRLRGFVHNAYLHFSQRIRSRVFIKGLSWGIITWGFSYLNVALFLHLSADAAIGPAAALTVFVATTLGGAVPVLPGGIGTYEASAIAVLIHLGYSFDEAFALALALHSAQLIVPVILTACILITEGIGVHSLVKQIKSGL